MKRVDCSAIVFGLAVVLVYLSTASMACAIGLVAAWGCNSSGQCTVPSGLTKMKAVAGGWGHSLALRSDGTVVAWGFNYYGQATVPQGLSSVRAIAAGYYHSLALKADGTVVAWGNNDYGQTNVPSGLSGVVAIVAGAYHSLALRSDGRVVAWGDNCYGQTNLPPGLSNVVAIAAGGYHNLALKADGTVVAWGDNEYGQTDVPSDLSGVVAIAAGAYHSLALRSDGTVVAWGDNCYGQTNVPPGLSNVVAIAAGGYHNLALKADGTVVAWGDNESGQTNVPACLSNAIAIAAGSYHSLAIVPEGPVQIIQEPQSQEVQLDSIVTFSVTAVGYGPISYQWYFNGQVLTNSSRLSGANGPILTIVNAQYADIGAYSVLVSNDFGSVISRVATLTVIGPPIITQHPTGRTVRAGSDVTFEVGAQGTPPMSFQLLLNGTNVVSTTKIALPDATAVFVLTNVQPVDSGVYSVLVSNAYGSALSAEATLIVTDSPPYIVVQPVGQQSNITVQAYSTVTMRVIARGSEPIWYQWRFNGVDIPGATNATLVLTNVTVDKTGYYSVLVSNPFGQTNSAKAYLSVVQVYVLPYMPSDLPAALSNVIAIAAGEYHVLALKADGTVATWPMSYYSLPLLTNVPARVTNVVAIAAGGNVSMALRADGSVIAWGVGPTNAPIGVSNVIAIATSGSHCLAVRSNGTVIGWGDNSYGKATPPAGLSNVISVAVGYNHSVALKADGTVVAWGSNYTNVPPGLSNVIAISAGGSLTMALTADGKVVGWGYNPAYIPKDLSNVVAISAGTYGNLWLKADGTVAGKVSSSSLQPPQLSNVVAIACAPDGRYGVVAVGSGAPAITIHPASQFVSKGDTVQLHVRAAGVQPMFYQWQLDGANIPGATNADLVITNFKGKDAGAYRAIVSNALGTVTSRVAVLTILVDTNLAIALNATNLVWDTWSATNAPWVGQQNRSNGLWFAQGRETHDEAAAAQSGSVGHNQQSVLQTTVVGPGTLTFWWKVSSELGYDFLRFYIDTFYTPKASISGETEWQQMTFAIGPDTHTLRWAYAKDGSVSSGRDAGWVDEVVFIPAPPVIEQQPTNVIAWAGDTVTFAVTASGSPPFTYQWLKDGTNLLAANESLLTLTNVTRRDSGTYSVVVCNSGGCVSSSNATLTVLVQQRLSAPAMASDGSFVFVSGDADGGLLSPEDISRFEVQASTNLVDWVSLPGTISVTNGVLQVTDFEATNYPARFYRIVER